LFAGVTREGSTKLLTKSEWRWNDRFSNGKTEEPGKIGGYMVDFNSIWSRLGATVY